MTSFFVSLKHFIGNVMGVRAICIVFVRIWALIGYMLRKNMRAVSFNKNTYCYKIFILQASK